MALQESTDRRKYLRLKLQPPAIGAIWPYAPGENRSDSYGKIARIHFIDICDRSPEGVAFRSLSRFDTGERFYLSIYQSADKRWENFIATTLWHTFEPAKGGNCFAGMRLTPISERLEVILPPVAEKTGPLPADYEFFRTVPFLRAIHRDAVCPLLNHITYRFAKAEERFITQGEKGDNCYIVQSGGCRVAVEKEGRMHQVGYIGKRDFVGEIAILTDEPRSAHVYAAEDTELWEIRSGLLDHLIQVNPEVATFLSEIVSERLSSRKFTADRCIGKYQITDVIGRGGYAIIYRGCHVELNRPVAIKMLKHDLALHPDFSCGFRVEARTIAGFNHENIVKVFDIEERYRTIFIIMECLEGCTLKDLLRDEGRLSVTTTLETLLGVCKGLHYAHERGIIHQDIKPANIFITAEGQVKLLDFGLSAPCGSEHLLTGTPFYMSPEQVECLPIDERTDIYSLGLTVYEMITGKRPFSSEDAFEVMNRHVECDVPDPVDLVPDIPDLLREFIVRACARRTEDRIREIPEGLRLLEPLAKHLGLSLEGRNQNRRQMTTLLLSYHDSQKLEVNRLLEDFSNRFKRLGVKLRAVEFQDI